MKLLFDENLAERLVRDVADIYPASSHVLALRLGGAADEVIWARAADEGFVLVTKDEDYHRLSVIRGPPPKVIWVRLGNCATEPIARLLRARAQEVRAFIAHPEAAFLALG